MVSENIDGNPIWVISDERSKVNLDFRGVFIAIFSRLNKLISVMTLASTALKKLYFQMIPIKMHWEANLTLTLTFDNHFSKLG